MTSASSEELVHATVFLDEEVRGFGHERNLGKSKGVGRKNLEIVEGGGEAIENNDLKNVAEIVDICILVFQCSASDLVFSPFRLQTMIPKKKIGYQRRRIFAFYPELDHLIL